MHAWNKCKPSLNYMVSYLIMEYVQISFT